MTLEGHGMCAPEDPQVALLRAEVEVWKERCKEILAALDRAHDPIRCPRSSVCWACNVLKLYKDQIPDQHLAVCSVCKELIPDTFAARKAAWCEKCEGYSHSNCWAAHNLNYCIHRTQARSKTE